MEPVIKSMTIKELIKLNPSTTADYQRNDDAWPTKQKWAFFDSIINGVYIPPLLIANNELVDGLQRFSCIKDYDRLDMIDDLHNDIHDRDSPMMKKFYERKLFVVDLGNESPDEIRKLFILINKSSIKLSKREELLAKMEITYRNFLINLVKNNDMILRELGIGPTRRFVVEGLLARCIAILVIPNDTSGVRHFVEKLFNTENSATFLPPDKIDEYRNKIPKYLSKMKQLLGDNVIPQKTYKVFFETLFVTVAKNFQHFVSHPASMTNEQFNEFNNFLKENQMGGGIKYDSITYISQRIDRLTKILHESN